MGKSTTKGLRIFAVGFTIFILLVFSAVLIRTATRQILVKHMGITNGFTEFVLFDATSLNEVDVATTSSVEIDWQDLYPFYDDNGNIIETVDKIEADPTFIELFKEKVEGIESNIETYVTDYLPFYRSITELSGSYESLLLWNFSPESEYNNVTKLDDGYLVGITGKTDVTEAADSTIELARFCEEQGCEFVYMQIPSKICQYEDADISGTMDFSNQNMDDFLELLEKAGVTTYDHRSDIHNEGLNHHAMFFNTDHHWKGQSGLWAAQHILKFLNSKYGYNLNTEILDSDNFDEVVYENWFLGSQGKKVTLSAATPENISLLYPKYETLLHYEIPSLGIDEYGSFDITYMMDCIETKDYYNKNPYGAYNHADCPLIRIENKLINDGPRVLVIHKSFSNCVIPFMSMGIKYVDSIDLRHFDSSLQTFIKEEKPDIVIVTYESVSGSVDYSTHKDVFDFR